MYPGFGDTYPIFNGALGMTYEKGGIGAGVAIKTESKDTLTLKERIDHHYLTGIATIEATYKNVDRVLEEFKVFFTTRNQGSFFLSDYAEDRDSYVKISSSWKEGPIICTSYTGTYSIKNQWPLPGIGGVKRKTHMGVACKMPDGRYVEKPRGLGLHPDWEPIVADPNGCSYRDCN